MARRPRLDVPGVVQHVIQRGNDRQACFRTDADRHRYLRCLRDAAQGHAVAIHAYVLMTNHVHLLVTPSERLAMAGMMQALGRRCFGVVNAIWKRTGTLCEGRYKSCVVDSDAYLRACHRCIECNPLRAAMVTDPVDFRWSSHACNVFGRVDHLVSPHACYLALGATPADRQRACRRLCMADVDASELAIIREHVQRQIVLGSARFQPCIGLGSGSGTVGRGALRPADEIDESGVCSMRV